VAHTQTGTPNPFTTLVTFLYDLYWRNPPLRCADCKVKVTRHELLDGSCPACWSAAQWTGGQTIDPNATALGDN
jgi:hypothetical protein